MGCGGFATYVLLCQEEEAQYIHHLCNPNCELVQWDVESLPHICFFAKKKIKSGMEFTFDYNWDRVRGQV